MCLFMDHWILDVYVNILIEIIKIYQKNAENVHVKNLIVNGVVDV